MGPRRVRGVVIATILSLTSLTSLHGAHADDDPGLALAQRDVDASDYAGARTALVAALQAGNAAPGDLAQLYKLSGIVEAALGNPVGATTEFAKWLTLDPKAALPPGTSPKIMRPFAAAAEAAKEREPLKVKAETSANPPEVTLVIVSDPLDLVSRARAFVSADGQPEKTIDASGKRRITIALPHGKRLDVRVQALDEHGNRIVELGSTDVPIVITGADVVIVNVTAPVKPAPAHARPLWQQWWLWGVAAVAFGAGGTYFGFQARSETQTLDELNKTSEDHKFTDALAVQSTAQRDVLLFNIGMGATGVLAIGAAILYLTEPKTETRLAAIPVNGGGALVLGGHF